MRTHQRPGPLVWAAFGLVFGGLVACAGQQTKPQGQVYNTGGQQQAQGQVPPTGGATASAQGAQGMQGMQGTQGMQSAQGTRGTQAGKAPGESGLKLGQEVTVPGVATIETTRTQTRVERRKIPTVEERSLKADINKMSSDDFVALGLDRRSANQVIQYRRQTGPFASVDELDNVPGINMAWVDRLGDRLAAG